MQPTTLATVRVQADDGYYFAKKPYLKSTFKDNIKLELNSITKNSKNLITDYYFKLVYKNTINTSALNNINAKLKSMSYGGEYCDSDWRVLFKIEKGE